MNIKLKNCGIRSWREEDAESLTYHANNKDAKQYKPKGRRIPNPMI